MTLLLRSIVHPWLCDIMGHLTTRHYMGMFDDANLLLLHEATGWQAGGEGWADMGWADVRNELEYKDELPAGTFIEITGGLKRIGTSSLEIFLEMRRMDRKSLAATMLAKIVFFDLSRRKSRPLSEEMRDRAAKFLLAADETSGG
ncbi:acyl-CoA thioesterase [Mesorhizobium sp. CO1-1-8]|uniref:acyl-CoA thioesterase n=1 Tax=Mesorhizobium sp. CO1-1-8 TaxID=2876631 RepID=UPI001CD1151E|nr:acyl-CoA thioesterase [Mesorhizobium sp. CO1-1-8]MBZ9772263.1 thioesterase family protein [Mesorhizobium sp. CO1-1-8]